MSARLRVLTIVAGCGGLLLTCPTPAAAQQDPPRGYVQGLAGSATTSVTDSLFAGGAAFRVADRVEAFGEIGWLRNAIWKELDDELSAAEETIRQQIAFQFGTQASVEFDALVPVWYGLGGARLIGPRLGPLTTYGEVGIGLARLRPEVRLTIDGTELDDEAGRLLDLDEERSELMSAAGAGVSCRFLRVLRLEGGYRYSRIYGDAPVNVHRVHGGIGFTF